ncbi:MAG: CADD family putative folate metabolism protein [Acidobacteriota bacterium]
MPTTIEILNQKIEAKHLLKHAFYQAWTKGELSLDDLRSYSRQYFAQVRAFPAYLSEMHSHCEDLNSRRVIAANLADEEATSPTHPELWLDFAQGLGVSSEEVLNHQPGPKFQALVNTFRDLAGQDTGTAAAALYCYEKQIPAVSHEKIAGLKANYGIESDATLKYFAVHEEADVEHAAQWEELLQRHQISAEQATKVADRVLDALNGALDEVYSGCACMSVN